MLCNTWLSLLNCPKDASSHPSMQCLGTVGENLVLVTASWTAPSAFQCRISSEILQPLALYMQSWLCLKIPVSAEATLKQSFISKGKQRNIWMGSFTLDRVPITGDTLWALSITERNIQTQHVPPHSPLFISFPTPV